MQTVRIDALALGGRGVGRVDGRVWFVPGAVPGDRVRAEACRDRGSFVEARPLELLTASPQRRHPPCPLQPACGGCPWMPLPEAEQRAWKERLLLEALRRIGGLEAPPLEPLRAPTEPLGYRNRVEFTIRLSGAAGLPVVGLRRAASPAAVLDVERCLLQDTAANDVLATVRRWLAERPRTPPPRGEFRLAIRRSEGTGELLVALGETTTRFPQARSLARALRREHPRVAGVVRLRLRRGGRGGARTERLAGRDWLDERVAGLHLRLSAASFVQVSGRGAEELVGLVADCAGSAAGARVVDLYSGVGLFGLDLLRRGAAVATLCDADGAAIACARLAAREADLEDRLRLVVADVGRWLRGPGCEADLVVANPPRRGLGRPVVEALRRLAAPRIVLVSCDPATLARDLAGLAADGAYSIRRVVPVDLFPQTAHVEAVAQLEATRVRPAADPRRRPRAGSPPPGSG